MSESDCVVHAECEDGADEMACEDADDTVMTTMMTMMMKMMTMMITVMQMNEHGDDFMRPVRLCCMTLNDDGTQMRWHVKMHAW